MQIDIQARSFTLTTSLRTYTERRLQLALSCCETHVKRVAVRLSDINGPRGGADKHCHIQVVMPGLNDIVIEDTELDMYAAIDNAVDRASRTVLRKVNRQQTISRHRHQQPEISVEQAL